jgi:hypothetical protein
MVESLAPRATDKSFADGIHIRGTHSRLDHTRAHALGDAVKGGAELLVAISNQKPWGQAVHRGVAQLLRRRLLGWVPRGRDVDLRGANTPYVNST